MDKNNNYIPDVQFKFETIAIVSKPLMLKYRYAKRIGQKKIHWCKNLNWKQTTISHWNSQLIDDLNVYYSVQQNRQEEKL